MVMLTFSVLDRKQPFWVNLIQKTRIVSLSWNLVPQLIWICRIQWWCSLFRFWLEIPFLDKLGPQNQNCQCKLKFGTQSNSNMQNAMTVFTFSILDGKHSFWAHLVQKLEIVSVSWNLVPRLIRICRIEWRCYFFLV